MMKLSTIANLSNEINLNWNIYRQFLTFADFKNCTIFLKKIRCVPSVTEGIKLSYAAVIYTSGVNWNEEKEIPIIGEGREINQKRILKMFIRSIFTDCRKQFEDLFHKSKFDERWKGCGECKCYMCVRNESCSLCGCLSGSCKENHQSPIDFCVTGIKRRGVGENEIRKHSIYPRKAYYEVNKELEQ